MSAPLGHTGNSEGNNIINFVQWIDSILTSDILVNGNFLRIEDEKGKKRKREESLEEAATDKLRNAKRFPCENVRNMSKTLVRDEEDIENYHREGNKQVASSPLYRNIKRSTDLYPSEPDEIIISFQADQENDLIDRERMFPKEKSPNDDSSSCDISEIESDEEQNEGMAKSGSKDAEEKSSLIVNRSYTRGSSEYGYTHEEVKGGSPGPFVYDITSSLMFFSSDEDHYDGEEGDRNGEKDAREETSRSSNYLPSCLNYDKMEKNISTMREMDDEFYNLSRQDHQKGEGAKDLDDTGITVPAVTAKVDREYNPPLTDHVRNEGKVATSSNDNRWATNQEEGNNVSNRNVTNLKAGERTKNQEQVSPKNAATNFSFWNIAHETYVTRPLYAQHLKKEQVSLLDESEEMVKSYSVNKYSIKYVPRHLLYVVSQVASRTFFDPLYRKKLFRHY
ncbi:conserved Plasmodium protein, unknown function [Plasmodium knowlesi strain H]|uniref:Uncharacterized protein n=3 Tax=Plasmodium knowlesi TaxID=5850 RepID=A0A5K1UJM9_PLAKH|nr:conserved Plasmodium protein, unknown function [Plasmodium knowlesi strain H]OTN66619.1 Uncharacterized protein PKNOH_S08491200 [Plasmodium knowlesi]CAA9986817.1 conserved Plasmodium protein, unknown function [Plasmodium knowlesi strain H]SBO23665.1 conserved Plasmodium protein, unknown function [Plasmodium knowlesi strain H]SBO25235.1 conserved Plasmodium protein, unknown function [Plasmodium knowlesi strain H]VVS76291.1 conserved Plasmodium protein, unknown function [Plasmodium knowlesi s|eukprot:XP_002258002.1 hypothetical protein, conserved in Plasmodium species [Plasmodium knowlesi strain H]